MQYGVVGIKGDKMIKKDNDWIRIKYPEESNILDECVRWINDNDCKKIIVISNDKNDTLAFLEGIKNPSKIKDLSIYGDFEDFDIIYKFTDIEEIHGHFGENKVDLAKFPNLKTISTETLAAYQNLNQSRIERLSYGNVSGSFVAEIDLLNQITSLKKIIFFRMKNFSLSQLILPNLEFIQCTQCSIKNLNGIEKFNNFKKLYLYYCRSLESIEGISKLPNLKSIWLCACPRLTDISEIGKVENLVMLIMESMKKANIDFLADLKAKDTIECIDLENCADLHSLKFLDNYPNLKMFGFWNTNVLDGNLTPCLRLKLAATGNKRHYNLKSNQLPFDNVHYCTSRWWNI